MLCSQPGHRAAECNVLPKCASCLDMDEPTDHFPASSKCKAHKLCLLGRKSTTADVRATDIERVPPKPSS